MRIKEITIGGSRTINLGNYESMQIQGSCTVSIDEKHDVDLARKTAVDELVLQLQSSYTAVKPKKKT